MRVCFKVNLGSQDAAKLGLDFKACLVGCEVECSDGSGQWLVAHGIANDVTPPKPKEPEPVFAESQGEKAVEESREQPDAVPDPKAHRHTKQKK